MTPLVHAAIAVIERSGRYLVSHRRAGSHLAGLWEFPGGKRQSGETWQACLRREMREELSVEVACGRRLAPIRFAYSDRRVRLEVFRCRIVRGRPRALHAQAIRWVTPAQLARLRVPSANHALIQRLTRTQHA
jgi:mutator protein MutT